VRIDPRFEPAVIAELALSERRARRRDPSRGARALAHRLHRDRHDLLAHLRRAAYAVPKAFRPVSWLHHAREANVTPCALTGAGLTNSEVPAVELFDASLAPRSSALQQARSLSNAPAGPVSSRAPLHLKRSKIGSRLTAGR
jgi:hypothetical protein